MSKIAVQGGTFNPVHYGHLLPVVEVSKQFNLDKVLFIPTGNPNFKQGEVETSRHDRAAMLELALSECNEGLVVWDNALDDLCDMQCLQYLQSPKYQKQPKRCDFVLDRRELEREGVTYSVDTFEELQTQYPNDELYFIVGSDCAMHIMSWKNARRLSEMCTLLVTQRRGASFDDVRVAHKKSLEERGFCFECEFAHTHEVPLSSTEIRAHIKQGESIDKYVPTSVAHYIKEHKLYSA